MANPCLYMSSKQQFDRMLIRAAQAHDVDPEQFSTAEQMSHENMESVFLVRCEVCREVHTLRQNRVNEASIYEIANDLMRPIVMRHKYCRAEFQEVKKEKPKPAKVEPTPIRRKRKILL